MSVSNALQRAIYELLIGDAAVSAFVGDRVCDAPPSTVQSPCITFGPSDVVFDEEVCSSGRVETVQLDLWSDAQDGKREVKAMCDAVKRALDGAEPSLIDGQLIAMQVLSMRVFDDPGGGYHGVVPVECTIED
ncbi:hypothetical protein GCM10011452_09210 [Gemmobacter lanyuensis]|uniref:DUF3168 domain-containing protein n=1 Tax=Gemmobacter lanyuensis TaxID=1054497 RepID=A0A918MIC8_9RHOB|nr:DUF3168 domain-containing protein [Gemmobacter lanyuensis]GGW23991.1 hypothetical protein GCM10011452_09210 [Gemmobacter lanyuensis]